MSDEKPKLAPSSTTSRLEITYAVLEDTLKRLKEAQVSAPELVQQGEAHLVKVQAAMKLDVGNPARREIVEAALDYQREVRTILVRIRKDKLGY